ncbi:unnamed protein product, partial [Rotaria magnacalcarata]
MSMSNQELFNRLQQLGCNPPAINDKNRMFALALIYNLELEQGINQDESLMEPEIIEEKFAYNDQR